MGGTRTLQACASSKLGGNLSFCLRAMFGWSFDFHYVLNRTRDFEVPNPSAPIHEEAMDGILDTQHCLYCMLQTESSYDSFDSRSNAIIYAGKKTQSRLEGTEALFPKKHVSASNISQVNNLPITPIKFFFEFRIRIQGRS